MSSHLVVPPVKGEVGQVGWDFRVGVRRAGAVKVNKCSLSVTNDSLESTWSPQAVYLQNASSWRANHSPHRHSPSLHIHLKLQRELGPIYNHTHDLNTEELCKWYALGKKSPLGRALNETSLARKRTQPKQLLFVCICHLAGIMCLWKVDKFPLLLWVTSLTILSPWPCWMWLRDTI